MFKFLLKRKAEVPTGDDPPVPREESTAVRTSHQVLRKNYQAVPASNRNAHHVLSSERHYHAVPASNRKAQWVPSSERNYYSVPASNRKPPQVLRKNYHSVPALNRNPLPVSNSNLRPPVYDGIQSCNYCHRRPRLRGHGQCGKTCKSRPKYKLSELCGRCCKLLPTMRAPLLLEAPIGHATWGLVQKKFEKSWNYGACPTIKKIYKIIGSKKLLQRYEQYKQRMGRSTEVFCYHGTSRRCTLGSNGNTILCNDSGCSLCSILKSSFKTSCANPNGAFGPGIYPSSAANKAYSYSTNGQGAVIVTRVVLEKVYRVSKFAAVTFCPAGYNSVVFNRQGGALNETIVYSDHAIRPVFLILFQ